MRTKGFIMLAGAAVAVAGCGEEPVPRSVSDFLADPIALEATLARCNEQRNMSRGDAECRNARSANQKVSKAEEAERARRLNIESQKKLDALRRRNQELEEGRRAAEQRAAALEEQLYQQQFQELEPAADVADAAAKDGAAAADDIDSPDASGSQAPDAGVDDTIREQVKRIGDSTEAGAPIEEPAAGDEDDSGR